MKLCRSQCLWCMVWLRNIRTPRQPSPLPFFCPCFLQELMGLESRKAAPRVWPYAWLPAQPVWHTAGIPWSCTNPPQLLQLKTSHHTPTLCSWKAQATWRVRHVRPAGQCTSMPRWYNWGICQQDSASTILLAMKSILSTWDTLEQAISILASVMLLSSSTENSDKASNITCAAHRTPRKKHSLISARLWWAIFAFRRIKNQSRAKHPKHYSILLG